MSNYNFKVLKVVTLDYRLPLGWGQGPGEASLKK